MIDLAVVGGGPVGLAAALWAARSGLSATVFEPRTGPVDKACGEGLMPGAMDMLGELGVSPEGVALQGIRYLDDRRSAEARFRSGTGRGVRRTTLHAALRAAVDAAGVPVLSQAVTTLDQHADAVSVNGTAARFVVAADGLHSPTRRRLGLDARPGRSRRYGLRCHLDLQPWTDLVEVHWSRDAEAYVTPVAPDQVGVAVLTSSRQPFKAQLAEFPRLQKRIAGAAGSKVLGAGPLRQRSTRRVAGRVLLAGDASGYVDALTGEGVAVGLAQARAAVAAIADGDPARYERDWRLVSWRYQAITHALLGVARLGPARQALVPLAATVPGVFSAAVNELARRPTDLPRSPVT